MAGAVSIDWDRLGQLTFDRTVEMLVRHRFGERVRAVNGRGGDAGIDIEVALPDGRLWILQLKYFPEGFSSQWRKRRSEIRGSYVTAMQHQPDKWTLVVPCLCTTPEHRWVQRLNGAEDAPDIGVIDRDDLDSWTADAPSIEASVHRTATTEMERLAGVYNMERAALLGGLSDVVERVQALGAVTNTVDLDWSMDFAQRDGVSSVTVRPRDADAPRRSPIGFRVDMAAIGDEHQALYEDLMRNVGYSTSSPLRIPEALVQAVHFEGPDFIAGEYPPGAVAILTAPRGAIGLPLELRAYQDEAMVASFEGRITHAASGSVGGSIEADFCDGHLRVGLRMHQEGALPDPVPTFLKPGIDLTLNYGALRPAALEEVLATRRVLCFATHLEAYVQGQRLFRALSTNPPQTAEDYDLDLLAAEQFAYDLDVVQQHTGFFFDVPDTLDPVDRVRIRIARLLLEGHIVASPRVPKFTLGLTGVDSPQLRKNLTEPCHICWPAGPYEVPLGGRRLPIGDVYVAHPQAIAVNGAAAIAALESAEAEGFLVEFRPGEDEYFYVTLADVPSDQAERRSVSEWSLHGITQPNTMPD